MSPKDLAQLFVKTWNLREASYVPREGQVGHYAKSYSDCACEVTDDPFLQQVLSIGCAWSGEIVDAAETYLKDEGA